MVQADKIKHAVGSMLLVVAFSVAIAVLKSFGAIQLSGDKIVVAASILAFCLGLIKEITDYYSFSLPGFPPCPCHSEALDVLANTVGILVGCMLVVVAYMVKTRRYREARMQQDIFIERLQV